MADDVDTRFKDIWMYCMMKHPGIGTLPGGPCRDCVGKYAITGPPALPRSIPQIVFSHAAP